MKKTFLILGFTLLLNSCAAYYHRVEVVRAKNKEYIERTTPQAPFGRPDDIQKFYSGDNGYLYATVTYIYKCYNGRYTAVTYTYNDRWTQSIYTSMCVK